ncbi:CHASE domain-containing protein [Coraliomargarita sp. W4R72]
MIGRIPPAPPLIENIKAHPLLSNGITALIYWIASGIGLQLALIYGNVSPIWPASGFAVTAIYFGGYRLLPGILIGAISAYASVDMHPLSSMVIAVGNCGEAAVAAWLLNRLRPLGTYLGQYTTPAWILVTSLIAPIVSAILGSFSILYFNTDPAPVYFWQAAMTWLAGDMIGILIIVPAILTLKRPSFSLIWCIKLIGLSALSLLLYVLILSSRSDSPLLFLAFIPLILACRWFGQTGCVWSTLSFVIFSSLAIFTNPESNILASSNYELLALDAFLIALSVTSLTIATLYNKGQFQIPTVLFILGWFSSGFIYHTLQSTSNKADQTNFIKLTHDIESSITDRLSTYTDALIAGAGMFINSEELKQEEWRSFVEHLKLAKRYPGINGIGFIQPIYAADLSDLVTNKRANGIPDFKIKEVPGVQRPPPDAMGYEHYIITYIESLTTNSKALGLDVASEVNRQTAGQRARDTGQPAMTDRIVLVQDGMSRPGFLLFNPMYRSGEPTTTVKERREALIGWSYAPFITEVFLNGVLGNRENQIQFDIYDSQEIAPSSFLFSTTGRDPGEVAPPFAHVSTIELADQTFSFGWNRGASFQKQETASATIAAASLALGSCLLVVIVVNLQTTNRRAKRIVEARTLALSEANDKLHREVHERQKAESNAKQAHKVAASANMAKSEFLATMSHEIRTPMNSVIGFAELLCASQLNADQRMWATYIQSSGNSLLSLINDILDFSKIEAGKLELEAISFSIYQALDEVVCGLAPIAAQKGLLIDLEASEAIPKEVVGDPTRFKQVVINLVANSLKFTEKGSIVVSATWMGDAKSGTATISIVDSGIGIPEDKIAHLFERFSQVDNSTTRQYGGTGLGLAICKRIVDLMHGQIQVDKTDHSGTTISFKIPLTASKQSEIREPRPHASPSIPSENVVNKRRVLVVDDNAVNRKLAETVIRRWGHEVDTATNGIEAIERVTKKFYDTVFLDCQMPIMDGYNATRRIRQLEAEGKIPGCNQNHTLPIIALTANASERDRKACLECGMDSYICKPARIKDFRKVFEQLEQSQRSVST